MFSARQLSQQIAALADDQFGAFEDWFRAESRDAHNDEDDQIVFAVEDVLSRYHYERLRGDALKLELENAIRPFAPPVEVVSFALYVGQQLRGPVSGNNSVPIFQSQRYIRIFEEMADGRSHSAYTALPAKKPAYGVGHPLEDPGSVMEVLPLHAEPA